MTFFSRWRQGTRCEAKMGFEHVDESAEHWPDPDPLVHHRLMVELAQEQIARGVDRVSAFRMFGLELAETENSSEVAEQKVHSIKPAFAA